VVQEFVLRTAVRIAHRWSPRIQDEADTVRSAGTGTWAPGTRSCWSTAAGESRTP